MTVAPAEPAATLMLVRDRPAGGFQVFLVRRHDGSAFMPGVHVFPGGRLDPADGSTRLIDRLDLPTGPLPEGPDGGPLRVAVLRETWEECGVLLTAGDAAAPPPGAGGLADVLDRHDLRLAGDRLVYVGRWVTPEIRRLRYDTRFYLAAAPAGQRAEHTALETTAGAWFGPQGALDASQRGELVLVPPTLRNLELLARSTCAADALARAAAEPTPCVRPLMRVEDGRRVVILPGDPGHPSQGPRLTPGPTRLEQVDGFWRYVERSATRPRSPGRG